jgi:O-antigen ligase
VTIITSAAAIHIGLAVIREGGMTRLHGPFVNANHFAGYLQIPLAFAFGSVWREIFTGPGRARSSADAGERLETRVIGLVLRAILWILLLAGVVLTKSRGGIVAAAVTSIFLCVLGASRLRSRGRYATAAAAVLVAAGIGTVALQQQLVARFLEAGAGETTIDVRQKIWRSSLEAWKLFPHFGDGLGAFKEAYRRVQPADVTGLVEQAHNDFLQLLVTGGWVGALFGVVAFVSLYVILINGWRRQQHREESAFILAGLGALFALTLHGLVDFNMSLPAIPATLAVMLGASVAASQSRFER